MSRQHRYSTVPLTPSLLEGFRRVRNLDKQGITTPEIAELRARIDKRTRDLEGLYVFFGGVIDQSVVNEIVDLRIQLDGAYLRAGQALEPS